MSDQVERPEREDVLRAALIEALPRAINFRFLPPRVVDDPIWAEVADELLAALSPALDGDGVSVAELEQLRRIQDMVQGWLIDEDAYGGALRAAFDDKA